MTEKPDLPGLQRIADQLHDLANKPNLTLEEAKTALTAAADMIEADADLLQAFWDELSRV